MTYTPDITRYQQLVYGGATRAFDCTAWGGALVTDAHTQGAIRLSGRAIRLASDEPVPDPNSPGLNVNQVDTAIYNLTNGRVNLDTQRPTRAEMTTLVNQGRWANLAVKRSVLVDRGYGGGNGFRGAHDITVHADEFGVPIIGDPLVAHYMRSSWDAVLDAAQAVYNGVLIFASLSRDVVPSYRVSIHPPTGTRRRFYVFELGTNGAIIARRLDSTAGFSATCTEPRYRGGFFARPLVQLTSGGRKGLFLDAALSEKLP